MARSATTTLAASLAVCACTLGGCVTAQGDPAPARAAEPAPSSDAAPTQVLIAADSNLTDSNANGYPDTFQVVVYLFPASDVSAQPVWADGGFEFTLSGRDGGLIERWWFSPEMAAEARVRTPVGRAQSFFLRFGGDRDRMPQTVADLRCRFLGSEGRILEAGGATSVRIGARP